MVDPSDLPDDPNQGLIILVGVLVLAVAGALTYAIKLKADPAIVGDDVESLRQVVERIDRDVQKLVAAELEFQSKGWTSLPPDLASSAGLTAAIYDLRRDVGEMKSFLRKHDEWERQQKWPHD